MCLPIGCLKCIIGFQAWVTFLVGIGTMIIAIIFTVNEGDNIQDGDLSVTQGLMITFWVITGILLFFGLTGIIGSMKKISFCLFCYNIGNILTALGFLALAITGFVIAGGVDSRITCDTQSNYNTLYLTAESTFCQPACPCNYNSNYLNPTVLDSMTISATGPTNYEGCNPQYNTVSAKQLSKIESQQNCAGWCNEYPYYIFSDVNNQNGPSQSCFDASVQVAYDNGKTLGWISLGISLALWLMVTFTCCLCFHPEKKEEGGNFYTRMAYYDQ